MRAILFLMVIVSFPAFAGEIGTAVSCEITESGCTICYEDGVVTSMDCPANTGQYAISRNQSAIQSNTSAIRSNGNEIRDNRNNIRSNRSAINANQASIDRNMNAINDNATAIKGVNEAVAAVAAVPDLPHLRVRQMGLAVGVADTGSRGIGIQWGYAPNRRTFIGIGAGKSGDTTIGKASAGIVW